MRILHHLMLVFLTVIFLDSMKFNRTSISVGPIDCVDNYRKCWCYHCNGRRIGRDCQGTKQAEGNCKYCCWRDHAESSKITNQTLISNVSLKPKGSAKLKSDLKAKVVTPKPTPSTPKVSANKINPRKASADKVQPIEPISTPSATTDEPVTSRSGRTIKPKR